MSNLGMTDYDAIGIIVSLSAFFAWLVTVLWVSHSRPIEHLNIVYKVIVVALFGITAAKGADWYTHWCLAQYISKHSEKPKIATSQVTTPTYSKRSDDDQQLIKSLRGALAQALSAQRTPTVSPQLVQGIPDMQKAKRKKKVPSSGDTLPVR